MRPALSRVGERPTRVASAVCVALLSLLLLSALAAPRAGAARDFDMGFADDQFADSLLFSGAKKRNQWASRMASANASVVRVNTYWSTLVSGEPVAPRSPADPAYNWGKLDQVVKSVTSRGMRPLMTVLSAPSFAEAKRRPKNVRAGAWKPKPNKLGDFAAALATRYSGSFPDPKAPGRSLPRVTLYEAWNEPNLRNYLAPQRKGKKNKSPAHYRKMLNGFYAGIKSVSGSNQVVTAGTSPFGDSKGGRRMPPLEFWRDVFCLKNRKKLRFQSKGCPKPSRRAKLDIFGHNSINEPGDPPQRSASHPDNATAADMHELVDIIRAAEKHGTVQPRGKKHEVWSTELWFESSPPEKRDFALSKRKQADAVSFVQYLLWKQGVSAGIFLQIRDSKYTRKNPAVIGLQSGVYTFKGKKKPSLKAARFPLIADRKGKKRVLLWTRSPGSKAITFEVKRGKGWKRVAKKSAGRGDVITTQVRERGRAKFRARSGGKLKSRPWSVGKK